MFDVYKKDISKYIEIVDISKIYFSNDYSKNHDEKFQDDFNHIFSEFLEVIININKWEYDIISLEIKEFIKKIILN